jgi:hypothetical protein
VPPACPATTNAAWRAAGSICEKNRAAEVSKGAKRRAFYLAPRAGRGSAGALRDYWGAGAAHFGGSNPLVRQRSAIVGEVSAVMKARAAAGSVLLAGIAVA